MKRQVQLFIEGQRVELFKDEQISINLSVQNISDLDKTFTDFYSKLFGSGKPK